MAEENIENPEQENEEKVQHSIGEVMQLLSKLSSINLSLFCNIKSTSQ